MVNCQDCERELLGDENFCPGCGRSDPLAVISRSGIDNFLSDPLGNFLSPMSIREVGSDKAPPSAVQSMMSEPSGSTSSGTPTSTFTGKMEETETERPITGSLDPEPESPNARSEDTTLEPVTWVAMGLRAQDRGEVEEALACFENALELDRSFVRAWFHKGFVLGLMGLHKEALEAFSSAVKLDPKVAKAWNNMGVTYSQLDEHEDAIEAFERALDIKPECFEVLYNLGISHAASSNIEEALEAFDKALELEELHHQAWFNRGMALLRLGRNLEAVASFDRALKLRPEFPEALVARGRAQLSARDVDGARRSAEQALEHDPTYGPAHRLQADLSEAWA